MSTSARKKPSLGPHIHTHTISSFCFTEQTKLEVDYEKIWQQKIQFYGFSSFCIVTLSKKCVWGTCIHQQKHFSDVKLSWTWMNTTCQIPGNLQNANCYKTVNVSNTLWEHISQDFTAQSFYNIYQVTKDAYNVCY